MEKELKNLLLVYGNDKKYKCSVKRIMKLKFGNNQDVSKKIETHFKNI